MIQTPRTLFTALLATLALLAAPALASAEYLVPEGNSAVTQYTEGFPTGGGEKKTEGSKPATPGQAIGAGNARKLQQHGAEGAAVAEVAAETAPAPVVTPAGSADDGEAAPQHQAKGKQGQKESSRQQEEGATATLVTNGEGPSGSSGAGEVLGAATGLSGGSLGLLLPLVILAALAWALYYAWRRRNQPHPEPSRP